MEWVHHWRRFSRRPAVFSRWAQRRRGTSIGAVGGEGRLLLLRRICSELHQRNWNSRRTLRRTSLPTMGGGTTPSTAPAAAAGGSAR